MNEVLKRGKIAFKHMEPNIREIRLEQWEVLDALAYGKTRILEQVKEGL